MAGKKDLNRIKDVLKEKGKSQTWLASALDVDFVTISRYANNHRQPSIEVLFGDCEGVEGGCL
ncbi:MAG: helix-turn-helix transcriptional regulator [Bacteroidota bacterium]